MSILVFDNISKTYRGKTVLNQVSLQLDRKDRLGLIGHNGSGKTTVLRLIAGLETPDNEEASIIIAEGTILSYLRQEFKLERDDTGLPEHPELENLRREFAQIEVKMRENPDDKDILRDYSKLTTRLEATRAHDYPYRLAQIAAGLGLDLEQLQRSRKTLSGGERMRLELAGILVEDPDLLLLDEPTNHLDIESTEWLEDYLTKSNTALIVVSHDRSFLNNVCNLTCEINNGNFTIHRGNYSRFKELQTEQELRLDREEKKLSKAVKHEKEVVQTLLSHRKIASYHSRQKRLGKLSEALNDLKQRKQKVEPRFSLRQLAKVDAGIANRRIIETTGLSIRFPDSQEDLFDPVNFDIRSGQKLVFCGPNGCGKSSLLKALTAENPHAVGDIKVIPDLRYAKLDQHHRFDNPYLSIIETLMSYDEYLPSNRAQEILASYGFYELDLGKEVSTLSGGEKSRLALACILLQNPDVLFLDEPTNHLDIQSAEVLEVALNDFSGTVIAVSHDRYFIEQVANKIYGFVGRTIKEFPHYQAYRNAVEMWKQRAKESPDKKEMLPEGEPLFTPEEIKLVPTLKEVPLPSKNKQVDRQIRAKVALAIRKIEDEVDQLETETQELEASFNENTGMSEYEQYGQKQLRLESLLNLYVKANLVLEERN